MYDIIGKNVDSEKAKRVEVKDVRINGPADLKKIKALTCATGEDSFLLRRASKKAKIINPTLVEKFWKDEGLIRAVKENGAIFELPINSIIKSTPREKAKLLRYYKTFLKKCIKLKAGYVFTTRAESRYEIRSEREIIAIANVLGLTYEQAVYALNERWEEILAQ